MAIEGLQQPAKLGSSPRESRDRRRAKALGWAVSAGVHAVLLVALLSSASGQLMAVSSSGSEQGDMLVSIVRASSPSTQPPAETASGNLRPLIAKFSSDQPPVEVDVQHSTSSLAKLFQRLDHKTEPAPPHRDESRQLAQSSLQQTAADAANARPKGTDQGHDPNVGATNTGSTGGLWGAISPCWRDMASHSKIPVVIDVTLDRAGKLTTPPKIIRGGSSVSELRLQSEYYALSALAACMPRNDPRWGGNTYRLEFRPR